MKSTDVKKCVYEKPIIISNANIEGVIPAGLVAAIGAFTAGVASGVAVRNMLKASMLSTKEDRLVEVGVLV